MKIGYFIWSKKMQMSVYRENNSKNTSSKVSELTNLRWRAWSIWLLPSKKIQSMLTRRPLIRKLKWRRTRTAGWTQWLVVPSNSKKRKWSRGISSSNSRWRSSIKSSSSDKRTSTGSSTRQSSPMRGGCSTTRRHHRSWSSSTVTSSSSRSRRSRPPLSSE